MENEPPKKNQGRRAFILLGGFAAFGVATQLLPSVLDRANAGFRFVDHPLVPSFRSLARSEQSVPFDPFVGLDGAEDVIPEVEVSDLDGSIFYNRNDPRNVQLAYFSDLYCPYCRVLSQRVIALQSELEIDISWHETPIFGDASVRAAKGQVAAGRQGAYEVFHKSLVRTPVQVTDEFLLQRAGTLGLDIAQFQEDYESDETLTALGRSRAIANRFGFIGTPVLIVGRTVVEGQISQTNLRQLIALEARDLG